MPKSKKKSDNQSRISDKLRKQQQRSTSTRGTNNDGQTHPSSSTTDETFNIQCLRLPPGYTIPKKKTTEDDNLSILCEQTTTPSTSNGNKGFRLPPGYTIPKKKTTEDDNLSISCEQTTTPSTSNGNKGQTLKTTEDNVSLSMLSEQSTTPTTYNENKTLLRRQYKTQHQQKRRQETGYKLEEMQKNLASKRHARQQSEYKKSEQIKNRLSKQTKRRQVHELNDHEGNTDVLAKNSAHSTSEYREKEKIQDRIARRHARQNPEYRSKERTVELNVKRKERSEPEYRHQEKLKDATARKHARQDSECRSKERTVELNVKRKERSEPEYRHQEKLKDATARKHARQDSEYRSKERTVELNVKRKERSEPAFREQEKLKDATARKFARQDSECRSKERTVELKVKRKERSEPEYRHQEKLKDATARKHARQDSECRSKERTVELNVKRKERSEPEYRHREKLKDATARKHARQDSEYRSKERTVELNVKRKERSEPEFREIEKQRDATARKCARQDSDYREKERTVELNVKRKERSEPQYREIEKQKDATARKRARQDSGYRQKERTVELNVKRKERSEPEFREQEKLKDSRARRTARLDNEYRTCEKLKNSSSRRFKRLASRSTNTVDFINKFHEKISLGPVYICTCCNQLFYKHSVKTLPTSKKDSVLNILQQCPRTTSYERTIWICRTCNSYVVKGKIPPLSVMNGTTFPEKPAVMDQLNPLELTLLAVRLPFMKLHQAPRGKQRKLSGNMVLVPADVDNTVSQLPRLPTQTATIRATLKRRLAYKHHVYSLNIRPELLREAAKFLAETPLYRKFITYNRHWTMEEFPFEISTDDPNNTLPNSDKSLEETLNLTDNDQHNQSNSTTNCSKNINDEIQDDWCEDQVEPMSGQADTMLTTQDFVEHAERDTVYNFAPGEGKVPVSVFLEEHCEELAFPGIYCGSSRLPIKDRKMKLSYADIVKSELRNADRRAAMCVENLFFKTKKLQMKTLIDQTQLAVRKVKQSHSLTVKDVTGTAVDNLVHQDRAYKFLSSIRGSPPYFEKVSKDLFAMIRQLGPPTFFITLSAAETKWLYLLKILGQIVDKVTYSDEELDNMAWDEKCRLIQTDPVTCARHFDFCVSTFLKDILLECKPLGNVKDYFGRIEFQQRGSPHLHMMVWCENAPQYGEDPEQDVCNYIDKFISCHKPDFMEDVELADLVSLQIHRHSHTCKKKREKMCRFGYPKPPLQKTMILQPVTTPEITSEQKSHYKKKYKEIEEFLYSTDDEENEITYENFLSKFDLTEETYLLCIRTSLTKTTVMLKRSINESRTNNYNDTILRSWRANIDIQFILDVYACAAYVASYITKSHRGMSDLLRTAADEVKAGNTTLKQQIRIVGNRFLNAVEISAQEAAYITLQLPLKRSTRTVVFVNTSPPDERVSLLKPQYILQQMDDNDEDIHCNNDITRYSCRPKSMENVTLAEFVSLYKRKAIPSGPQLQSTTDPNFLKEQLQTVNDDDNDEDDEDNDNEPNSKQEDSYTYILRTHSQILRTVHFNPETDSEKYFRELIFLYSPWRNENKLKNEKESYADKYKTLEQQIEECRQRFEPYGQAVDMAEQYLQENELQEDAWDELAPENQQLEDEDFNQAASMTNQNTGIENYDIGPDIGLPTTMAVDDLHPYNEINDEDFRTHMRQLTPTQKQYVYDTLTLVKTSTEPFYRFLSGGAGVGKSFVTKALYQATLKFLNARAGDDFTTRKLLLVAPTGKAAYHIKGTTIHAAFRIPANQSLQHKPLPCGALNTLRNELADVKIIFIDEISMVGFNMFNCIHQRLMEVMNCQKPFGGISIIAVGDLFQLKPVMDAYLFSQPKGGYLPLASNLWQELFSMFELTEVMRQAENKSFANLLNRLREGYHTEEDVTTLKERTIQNTDINYPHFVTHLFATNAKVDSFNHSVLLRTDSQKNTFIAKDRVIGNTPPSIRNKVLSQFKASTQSKQLLSEITIAVDILYDLTVNLETTDGLINGASCVVKKIDTPDGTTIPRGIIWVKFFDQDIGKQLRQLSRHLFKAGIDHQWTPIQPIVKQFAAGQNGQIPVQRLQFPLKQAHGKTIHRSQGDTLPTAVVDLTSKRKIDHLHYVAISRLTSLQGLSLLNLQEDKISVSLQVKQEMLRLRATPTVFTHTALKEIPHQNKAVFLNCRSLHRHHPDIMVDQNVLSANIICLSETRLINSDTEQSTALPGYHQYRQDEKHPSRQRRPFHGLLIYSDTEFLTSIDVSDTFIEAALFKVIRYPDINFVTIYKPPQVSSKSLCAFMLSLHNKYLKDKKSVILGDFNVDWSTDSSQKNQLQTLMEQQLHFRQHISKATTDYNSTLDLIFTKLIATSTDNGTSEVYYSDHKLIWLAW